MGKIISCDNDKFISLSVTWEGNVYPTKQWFAFYLEGGIRAIEAIGEPFDTTLLYGRF